MAVPSKQMPTIMHLNASNFYGGPEKQIIEHLTRLNRNKFSGILASFRENKNENEILKQAERVGIRNFSIPMAGPLDFGALSYLKNLLERKRVDLLCTHGYKPTIMGWWAVKSLGIPIIAFSRGYTAENKKIALYEWLERKILKKVDAVICVSEGQKQKLASFGINHPKTWVVYNAVTINENNSDADRDKILDEKVRKDLGLTNSSAMIVSAGRLSPEKGHRYLVEATGMLGKQNNRTSFIFCGAGACQRELEALANNLDVADRCHFVGFRRDIRDIFQVMDFLVLPSLTEGLPNVVLEAFACKKTVVANAVGGVPEIVEDGVNGILIPPARSDLLAEGIEKLLSSKGKRAEMGEAGYQKVKTSFSFEKQNRQLERIYQTFCN